MTSQKRMLLVSDFAGANYPSALYAMQQWSQYVSQSDKYDTILGPTTFAHRSFPVGSCGVTGRDAVLMIAQTCAGMTTVYWDRYVDELALEILRRNGVGAQPFYTDFNYGSAVNRWLLLANEMSCDYVLRVDPGTRPPDEPFDELMGNRLNAMADLGTNAVISHGYDGRLAIRDDFLLGEANDEVRKKAIEEQCRIIKAITHIDPKSQVTGGAMFTSRVPGIPAIPFQKSKKGLTLVWGSDDAFFQLLPATDGSKNIGAPAIPRFDKVGKPKTTIEYYRGVLGMVALYSVMSGRETEAINAVESFLQDLIPILNKEFCKRHDRNPHWRETFIRKEIAPDEFIEQIVLGWRNHVALVQEWQTVCRTLKGQLYPHIQIT
jgi:hypothetical protein